jgi:glycosyltransferase involved in cell wall biosynthesis
VVFCGVMNYTPNEDAAVWMARHVWPAVRARRPDARLLLVGSDPSTRVQALADAETRVEVTGTVSDVRPYLWNAAVSVAPLLTARGTQNKVLEAVACGLPAVVTDVVAEGLPPQVLPACAIATTPAAFADAIAALLEATPAQRRAMVDRAAPSSLSWERSLIPLIDQLERAARAARK